MQDFGLQIRYTADEEFALTIRMLAALAFVPPNDVIDSFETLADYSRNGYGLELDDMFHRTDNELPRTNNVVEGWHRGFQSHVTTCHPSFWKFIDIMKQEEGVVRAGVLQNQGGHPSPPQRRRYTDNHARILRIVDDYANSGRIDYLRSNGYNTDF